MSESRKSVFGCFVLVFGLSLISVQRVKAEDTIEINSVSHGGGSKVYGSISLFQNEPQKVFVHNGLRKIDRVIVETPFRYEPQIIWHGKNYVEIVIGTGSPGRYSVFYDLQRDRVSKEMWFVVAFDGRRGVAVLGQERVTIVDVFSNRELFEIHLSNLPVSAITFLLIESGRFDSSGNLRLTYTDNVGRIRYYTLKSTEIDRSLKNE